MSRDGRGGLRKKLKRPSLSDMQTFHIETVVTKDGKIHLDQVPFPGGEAVHVYVSSASSSGRDTRETLKGSVLKYLSPFEPAAAESWEAAK